MTRDKPQPCVTVSFRVSSLFEDREGNTTSWFDISIPPDFATSGPLTLETPGDTNSTTFDFQDIFTNNDQCGVADHQVRYKGESKLLPYSITVEGKICVEFKSSSAEIEARIRYEGFD